MSQSSTCDGGSTGRTFHNEKKRQKICWLTVRFCSSPSFGLPMARIQQKWETVQRSRLSSVDAGWTPSQQHRHTSCSLELFDNLCTQITYNVHDCLIHEHISWLRVTVQTFFSQLIEVQLCSTQSYNHCQNIFKPFWNKILPQITSKHTHRKLCPVSGGFQIRVFGPWSTTNLHRLFLCLHSFCRYELWGAEQPISGSENHTRVPHMDIRSVTAVLLCWSIPLCCFSF